MAGDKYGVLKIINVKTRETVFCTKAHGSEILDIAIHEDGDKTLVASASRDRTVQLYKRMVEWTLLQTLDEHTASVNGLVFCDGGEKLVSISSDRTCIVRQISTREIQGQSVMAAIPNKVITLKASPVSMVLSPSLSIASLTISCLDKTVTTYEISTGKLVSSFRATDGDGNEAVVLDSLIMTKSNSVGGRSILAGVSTAVRFNSLLL